MSPPYLLDTHALHFWAVNEGLSPALAEFLDFHGAAGRLFVSSVSFWEIALLCKSGRISLKDPLGWTESVMANAPVKLLSPTVKDMIVSTQLPCHHRDPFDRLLIAQTVALRGLLVTRDKLIKKYAVKTFWRD